MRTLVVADVHANLAALTAVLDAAKASGAIDRVWCLGDVVGYGPEPNECIEVLREIETQSIAGNHDVAAIGGISTDDFNPFAAEAAHWTAANINDESRAWLTALPESIVEGDFTLVHGALTDPIWDYLISQRIAERHLKLQDTPYGLVGHSHVPLTFMRVGRRLQGTPLADGDFIKLNGSRFVANPGSVGQPRDGDVRAAYAVIDSDSARVDFHRVSYDIEATQKKIVKAGLPSYLAERLSRGR